VRRHGRASATAVGQLPAFTLSNGEELTSVNARSGVLSVAIGVALGATGCAHNAYDIANRSPSELKVVSDADLCYAQRYWQSPQMLNEIRSRRLDCLTGTRLPPPKTAKKPKKPSKPASGVAVGEVSTPQGDSGGRAPVDLDTVAPAPREAGGGGGGVDLDAEVE
jgi:hypothetical protein